jgi:hypothetical protein
MRLLSRPGALGIFSTRLYNPAHHGHWLLQYYAAHDPGRGFVGVDRTNDPYG